MEIKKLLKNTFLYKKIYYPRVEKKRNAWKSKIREAFLKEGENALREFVNCMNNEGITYWLEFGSLLGAYRDGAFVPNELDLDVGVYLKDANKIYSTLQQNGSRKIRENHEVGENGLEQTYEYKGTTIDLMFFYEKDGKLWCDGALFPKNVKSGKYFDYIVTSHFFKPFVCCDFNFLGMTVSVPSNTEEHLIEIFGPGYKVYDPNFKVDLNKVFYYNGEKKGYGFIIDIFA